MTRKQIKLHTSNKCPQIQHNTYRTFFDTIDNEFLLFI